MLPEARILRIGNAIEAPPCPKLWIARARGRAHRASVAARTKSRRREQICAQVREAVADSELIRTAESRF